MPEENKNRPSKKKSLSDNVYLKYSGMAFQMGAIILIGTLLGQKLDVYFGTPKAYLTILFALLSIAAAFYVTLKDLFLEDKK